MKEVETNNLTINIPEVQDTEPVYEVSRHTNPIQKKLLEYHKGKEKFSVLDLFRK